MTILLYLLLRGVVYAIFYSCVFFVWIVGMVFVVLGALLYGIFDLIRKPKPELPLAKKPFDASPRNPRMYYSNRR